MSTPSRSGVFSKAADSRVERFTESIRFDHRLYAHDIVGSIAHAEMLATVGLISAQECADICRTLEAIRVEIEAGNFAFKVELEDIHMHIEQALIERLGDVGRKLHTGRSRNDQVGTDLKLWVRSAVDEIDGRMLELQRALLAAAEREDKVILPGYTHLQRAQPIL